MIHAHAEAARSTNTVAEDSLTFFWKNVENYFTDRIKGVRMNPVQNVEEKSNIRTMSQRGMHTVEAFRHRLM